MTGERPLLAALLVAVAAIGGVALVRTRTDLRVARAETARIEAALARPVARPLPLLPADALSPSIESASATVRTAALRAGLLIETLRPAPAAPPLLRLDLVASGSGTAVLRLAESVEGGRPLLRFEAWRLARTPGGAVRLHATIAGVRR